MIECGNEYDVPIINSLIESVQERFCSLVNNGSPCEGKKRLGVVIVYFFFDMLCDYL